MNPVNRQALYVAPKKPLVDWVNYVFPDEEKISSEEPLSHDWGTIYLVPEFHSEEEFTVWLKDNYTLFFEQELFEWCEDETQWPEPLSFELFQEWFHYAFQSVVLDTLDIALEKEEEEEEWEL
jgi:hypothetical protein